MPFKKTSLFRYSSFPCIRISVNGMGENPRHGIPNALKNLRSVDPGQIIGFILKFLEKNKRID